MRGLRQAGWVRSQVSGRRQIGVCGTSPEQTGSRCPRSVSSLRNAARRIHSRRVSCWMPSGWPDFGSCNDQLNPACVWLTSPLPIEHRVDGLQIAARDGGVSELGCGENSNLGVLITVIQHSGSARFAGVGENQDTVACHVIDPRVDHLTHYSREPEFLAYLTAKGILRTVIGGIEPTARQLPFTAPIPQDNDLVVPAEHRLHRDRPTVIDPRVEFYFQTAIDESGSACLDDLRGRCVRRDDMRLELSQVGELVVHGFGARGLGRVATPPHPFRRGGV